MNMIEVFYSVCELGKVLEIRFIECQENEWKQQQHKVAQKAVFSFHIAGVLVRKVDLILLLTSLASRQPIKTDRCPSAMAKSIPLPTHFRVHGTEWFIRLLNSTKLSAMKKIYLLLVSLLILGACPASAQKILLKIASVTAAAGEEVKAAELRADGSISWSGGGAAVGKVSVKDFLIKKQNGTSSNDLFKKLLMGTAIPTVILEYYDASNTLYFTITLKTVFVTNFYWLSPECPTCLKLEHQVAFAPKQIETYDVATGVTVRYDLSTYSTY